MDVVHEMEAERAEPGSELQKALRKKVRELRGEADEAASGDALQHPAPTMLSSVMVIDCGEVQDNN